MAGIPQCFARQESGNPRRLAWTISPVRLKNEAEREEVLREPVHVPWHVPERVHMQSLVVCAIRHSPFVSSESAQVGQDFFARKSQDEH